MNRVKKDTLKELSSYSKTEIIEALENCFNSAYIAEDMLGYLKIQRENDLLARHEKAIDKENAARTSFLNWRVEMCKKYGDGKTVKLRDIPPEDMSMGAKLEKELCEATVTEHRLGKQVKNMLQVR